MADFLKFLFGRDKLSVPTESQAAPVGHAGKGSPLSNPISTGSPVFEPANAPAIRRIQELVSEYQQHVASSKQRKEQERRNNIDRRAWFNSRENDAGMKRYYYDRSHYEKERQEENQKDENTIQQLLTFWLPKFRATLQFSLPNPSSFLDIEAALKKFYAEKIELYKNPDHKKFAYTYWTETLGHGYTPGHYRELRGIFESIIQQHEAVLLETRKKLKQQLLARIDWTDEQLTQEIATFQGMLDRAAAGLPGTKQFEDPDCAELEDIISELKQRQPQGFPAPLGPDVPNDFVSFRLLGSSDDPATLDYHAAFFEALAAAQHPPLHFSLVASGNPATVYLLVSLRQQFLQRFEQQLLAFFPHAVLEPQDWQTFPRRYRASSAYRVVGPGPLNFISALRPLTNFNPDPYTSLCALAETLGGGETLVLSFEISRPPAAIQQYFAGYNTDESALEKFLNQPRWATTITASVATPEPRNRAMQILTNVKRQFLKQYEISDYRFAYADGSCRKDILSTIVSSWRHNHSTLSNDHYLQLATRNYFTTAELSSFIHLPQKTLTSPAFQRADMIDQKPPTELIAGLGLLLGTNVYRRQVQPIYIPEHYRSRHLYIVGASGSGKSTLITNLVKQNLEAGEGCAVIDPHGDLIADVLHFIPEDRVNDVIYFNAADRDFPVSLNPLSAATEIERDLVTSDFMVLFQRLFVVSDAYRLLHILRHTILTLLTAGNKTFADIRRLLTAPEYRRQVLAQIDDPALLEFWQEEFPSMPKGAADPIINKLSPFTLNRTVRNILGQPKNAIDFRTVMQTKKILLCNLAQGEIQQENSMLLGALLISQLQLAAMRRAAMPQHERTPFTLYVDEFQNFTASDPETFPKILSEARKYNLNLVLAHQFVSQLNPKVAEAIIGNVHTMAVFRVGVDDAHYLQKAMSSNFTSEYLQNLKVGECAVRSGTAQNTFLVQTAPPPVKPAVNCIAQVVAHTRSIYATPRSELESAQHRPLTTNEVAATEQPSAGAPKLPANNVLDDHFKSL